MQITREPGTIGAYTKRQPKIVPDQRTKRLVAKLAETHNLDINEVFFTKKLAYKDIVEARTAIIQEDNAFIHNPTK